MRYPILQQTLRLIRHIAPDSVQQVIDIGVQRKTDFLMDVLPDCHHHLFEPVSTYHADLELNYKARDISYDLYKFALAETNGTLFMHNTSGDASGKITHSYIKTERDESTKFLVNIDEIETRRLDDVFAQRNLYDMTYLVKLDVDGIEEKIISGGEDVIGSASFVVIEASIGRQNLCSRAALLERHGFRIFDICDNAYYYNQLAQVDIVMINNRLRDLEVKFRPWECSEGKVIWSKWQHGFTHLVDSPVNDPFQ